MISIQSISGSGSFPKDGAITYSYVEDASPKDPQDIDGGAGQISATLESDYSTRGSRLTINNRGELVDSEFGTLDFLIGQVSLTDNVISIVGETAQRALNTYRKAEPYGGTSSNLFGAINYYCSLCDVVPVIPEYLQTKMEAIPVEFVGWSGIVWDYLKQLCAAIPLDSNNNTLLEMYFVGDDLHFREGLLSSINTSDYVVESTLSVNNDQTARAVDVVNYNTSYGVNKVIKEQSTRATIFQANENVSITDSMQVNAGETLVRRFKINASLESVNQPVPVAAITSLPYTGVTGEYVVVGSDDLPILPEQWVAQGGSLTVALTENFDEIEITITAPASVTMPTADNPSTEVTPAPYKVGVESVGVEEYPALYITGTGVFFERTTETIITGSSEEYSPDEKASEIDNVFITNKADLYTRGVAAAQVLCGPNVLINQELAGGVQFGTSIGSIVSDWDSKFRITNISFGESGASLTAKSQVSFADFNSAWAGQTFANFATKNSELSFNEFSIIPLSKGA
jgi:hypothetical protein